MPWESTEWADERTDSACGNSGLSTFALVEEEASVITSKAANSYHFKTGQRKTPGT
jgi:hypothetical protein